MNTIPCLSLWQPWASLWVYGKKTIETRSWPLRGKMPRTIAVHAAKRFQQDEQLLCLDEPFRSALASIGYTKVGDLPLGCVLGLVDIVEVYCFDGTVPPEPECHFGNYESGRYGFRAANFRPFAKPIPVKGKQGVFRWQPSVELVFADGSTPLDLAHGVIAKPQLTKTQRLEPAGLFDSPPLIPANNPS